MKMMSQSFGSIGVFSFKQTSSRTPDPRQVWRWWTSLLYRGFTALFLKQKLFYTTEINESKTCLVYDIVDIL